MFSLSDLAIQALVAGGFVGVALITAAYFANQQGWLASHDWRFPAANLVGSMLIFASLFAQWNFPSAVIEAFWMSISTYGLLRSRRS
ncbi:MAG TPA: hypothetical protein VLI93_03935 [Acetobacteraceae bacterium]|nr:hypothetical protein [Acetobacteraceae bacterium]